eukprot:Sspe_Gene.115023::Locus_101662_Transcript_1_1_Confidence_1.000_Length_696::g.115023::m.115023
MARVRRKKSQMPLCVFFGGQALKEAWLFWNQAKHRGAVPWGEDSEERAWIRLFTIKPNFNKIYCEVQGRDPYDASDEDDEGVHLIDPRAVNPSGTPQEQVLLECHRLVRAARSAQHPSDRERYAKLLQEVAPQSWKPPEPSTPLPSVTECSGSSPPATSGSPEP